MQGRRFLPTHRINDPFRRVVVLSSGSFELALLSRIAAGCIAKVERTIDHHTQLRVRWYAILLMQKIPCAVEENKRGLTGVIPVGKITPFRGGEVRQNECDAILVIGMERVNDALKRSAVLSRRIVHLNDGGLSADCVEAGIINIARRPRNRRCRYPCWTG